MLLVIGGTGTLGMSLAKIAQLRGVKSKTVARSKADFSIDITDARAIRKLMEKQRPSLVVNCAALTDLNSCERDPNLAHRINADAPSILAKSAIEIGAQFVHVSTDHYFSGDRDEIHDELSLVKLVNVYARTKFDGELAALSFPGTLVIRTNFTGWRYWSAPTFIEWAVRALERREPMVAFSDFYTSTMHADGVSEAILDLVSIDSHGLFNVAAAAVFSKEHFIRSLARKLRISNDKINAGSVRSLPTARAESLGLDVRKVEAALQRKMPQLEDVISALVGSRSQELERLVEGSSPRGGAEKC